MVVNLPGSHIRRLTEELTKRGMLVPPQVILELLLQPEGDHPLNAIHLYRGIKADIFLQRMGDGYRATALARRRRIDLGPPIGETYMHAPEDRILNKVHDFSICGQEEHIRDIAAIRVYLEDQLERPYFDFWLDQLGLRPVWDEVQAAVATLLR